MAATGFHTADELNALLPGTFPGLIGVVIDSHEPGRLTAHLDVRPDVLAPNGYLHAATVVGLADTACGLATRALLPEGASGFTTIELKSNYLGTARDGRITTVATNVHAGRTTQVWDAAVSTEGSGKTIALFRCTQSVLWPRS
jgi:1,4-dihydroxy-2-naphthoyl-CoA hydrolase